MAVRIGFAYNLKPNLPTSPSGADNAPDSVVSAPSPAAPALNRSLRSDLPQPDLYAEWDEAETIDAVERALSGIGKVIRLEADADFPRRLLDARPDFVFNIAEGLYGVNREAHVPAICEFLGVPYHASDPLTLSLSLHKGRAKEVFAYHGVPTAPFIVANSRADARNVTLPFPLFAKPALEGSSKGITARSLCTNRAKLVSVVGELLEVYQQPVLIEAYLPGQEFTVAIVGNGREARCLPSSGCASTSCRSARRRSTVTKQSGFGIRRTVPWRCSTARPGSTRTSREKSAVLHLPLIASWGAATGPGSMCAAMHRVARMWSKSIRCLGFSRIRRTTPAFRKRRARPACRTTR